MPENLKPPGPSMTNGTTDDDLNDKENIRLLSRSPHPYHRQNWELLEPSDRVITTASSIPALGSDDVRDQLLPTTGFTKDSPPTTDSGTEADDENYIKRLPAPKARLHKGLRGRPEALSGSGTPLLTPIPGDGDPDGLVLKNKVRIREVQRKRQADNIKRRKEVFRRGTEVLILSALTKLVISNPTVKPVVALWGKELIFSCGLFALLLALYPLRVVIWAYVRGRTLKRYIPLSLPTSFDPASILYPQLLPVLVALLTAANLKDVILPNLILAIASIPRSLIPNPFASELEVSDPLHWLATCVPLIIYHSHSSLEGLELSQPVEILFFLYPLHQNLSVILYQLTTTSLLPAELQLLSISLIDLLVLSISPQAVILQAVLWIGGLGILILCGPAIRWSIALARVPKWRFRRDGSLTYVKTFIGFFFARRHKEVGTETEDSAGVSGFTTDEDNIKQPRALHRKSVSSQISGLYDGEPLKRTETISTLPTNETRVNYIEGLETFSLHSRSQSLPLENMLNRSKTHTPSGRRKRSASSSVRYFFTLTQEQANERKWAYAAWVYFWIAVIILGGIRWYVQYYSLDGNEPIGWALGYVLGGWGLFRLQVLLSIYLDQWICLPPRPAEDDESCYLGWVQHVRQASIGKSNTRLLLVSYWLGIIVAGLAVVFRLSPYYEVDTRRKIFHFMMVTMFLPTIYIDPAWCALALAIALAIFLLLDLLRASQLPPLSKPITNFLNPYTDGRDHCGPVVISHIFLLIGCAIPLWLSLSSLSRTGTGCLKGWEIPTRELSMVAGVVCVGLGDAAASLIGRRYGHHKWLWKGGKSIEGSVAFIMAVFVGLMAANLWLKIGGWPITSEIESQVETPHGFDAILTGLKEWHWSAVVSNTGICATVASLTEAVLTGGNDNVVVPVVLWICVKSTGL